MSDHVRSLIVAFLSLTAVLVLLPTVVQAGPVPNCVGTDACTGNTGAVGAGACIGNFSAPITRAISRRTAAMTRRRAIGTPAPWRAPATAR